MTIQVQTKGARVVPETTFHITVFGNFSGRQRNFEELSPQNLSANSWESLFQCLAPSVDVAVSLPRVADLPVKLSFNSLADFGEKGLGRVPFLAALKDFSSQIESASADAPLNANSLLAALPELAIAKEVACSGKGDEVLDLLSLVDIGESDDGGLTLPLLKTFFEKGVYDGKSKKALLAEVNKLRGLVLDQLLKNKDVSRLAGMWRALKELLPFSRRRDQGPLLQIDLFECHSEDLCDAVYLTYVKPDAADPKPLDLAICCHPLGASDPDRHILFHLGRMASALNVPFIMEADPSLFGCKTWSLVSHIQDLSGKLAGPAFAKWRKLRDESGSEWLFLAANPFRVQAQDEAEGSDSEPAAPACFLPARIMLDKLASGLWPSEMLGAWARVEATGRPLANFSAAQLNDLAFEGLMPITINPEGTFLTLEGFTCLATLKIPPRDQTNPANILEYTLPYRFYSGCCSRYLIGPDGTPRTEAEIAAYTSVKKAEDLRFEQAEDTTLIRVKAPFTLLGVQPDLILIRQDA